MATFDQLPAEQRAIIELVVARGRTYDALADVLQVSAERVRDLARDALVELSPVTGERVDPQWRGQIADYLLGQQSRAESTATQAHLKRSEPARAWALSLLDALDTLYANGDRPNVPDIEAAPPARGAVVEETAEEPEEAEEPEAVEEAEEEEAEEAAAEERPRERERERKREREGRERPAAAAPAPAKKKPQAERKAPVAGRSVLSPAAQSALRRRRMLGIGGGLAAIAIIVLLIVLITGGDDSEPAASNTNTTQTTPGGQPQVQGQIPLRAVGGAKAQGVAYILQQGGQRVLAVTAKLPPLPATQRQAAYNVWLYNSPKDSESIGAQFTTAKGDYQGVGPLPANYERFKFIDVSRQPFNNKTGHSGQSVLRGAVADLQPVPQGQQPPGGAQGGAGQAP